MTPITSNSSLNPLDNSTATGSRSLPIVGLNQANQTIESAATPNQVQQALSDSYVRKQFPEQANSPAPSWSSVASRTQLTTPQRRATSSAGFPPISAVNLVSRRRNTPDSRLQQQVLAGAPPEISDTSVVSSAPSSAPSSASSTLMTGHSHQAAGARPKSKGPSAAKPEATRLKLRESRQHRSKRDAQSTSTAVIGQIMKSATEGVKNNNGSALMYSEIFPVGKYRASLAVARCENLTMSNENDEDTKKALAAICNSLLRGAHNRDNFTAQASFLGNRIHRLTNSSEYQQFLASFNGTDNRTLVLTGINPQYFPTQYDQREDGRADHEFLAFIEMLFEANVEVLERLWQQAGVMARQYFTGFSQLTILAMGFGLGASLATLLGTFLVVIEMRHRKQRMAELEIRKKKRAEEKLAVVDDDDDAEIDANAEIDAVVEEGAGQIHPEQVDEKLVYLIDRLLAVLEQTELDFEPSQLLQNIDEDDDISEDDDVSDDDDDISEEDEISENKQVSEKNDAPENDDVSEDEDSAVKVALLSGESASNSGAIDVDITEPVTPFQQEIKRLLEAIVARIKRKHQPKELGLKASKAHRAGDAKLSNDDDEIDAAISRRGLRRTVELTAVDIHPPPEIETTTATQPTPEPTTEPITTENAVLEKVYDKGTQYDERDLSLAACVVPAKIMRRPININERNPLDKCETADVQKWEQRHKEIHDWEENQVAPPVEYYADRPEVPSYSLWDPLLMESMKKKKKLLPASLIFPTLPANLDKKRAEEIERDREKMRVAHRVDKQDQDETERADAAEKANKHRKKNQKKHILRLINREALARGEHRVAAASEQCLAFWETTCSPDQKSEQNSPEDSELTYFLEGMQVFPEQYYVEFDSLNAKEEIQQDKKLILERKNILFEGAHQQQLRERTRIDKGAREMTLTYIDVSTSTGKTNKQQLREKIQLTENAMKIPTAQHDMSTIIAPEDRRISSLVEEVVIEHLPDMMRHSTYKRVKHAAAIKRSVRAMRESSIQSGMVEELTKKVEQATMLTMENNMLAPLITEITSLLKTNLLPIIAQERGKQDGDESLKYLIGCTVAQYAAEAEEQNEDASDSDKDSADIQKKVWHLFEENRDDAESVKRMSYKGKVKDIKEKVTKVAVEYINLAVMNQTEFSFSAEIQVKMAEQIAAGLKDMLVERKVAQLKFTTHRRQVAAATKAMGKLKLGKLKSSDITKHAANRDAATKGDAPTKPVLELTPEQIKLEKVSTLFFEATKSKELAESKEKELAQLQQTLEVPEVETSAYSSFVRDAKIK